MREHHNHELTGEPYLGAICYGFMPCLAGRRKRWDWVFNKHVVDERGREYWASRKWPNMPFRVAYRVRYKLRPILCRLGVHHRADIVEIDASIWRAECFSCKKLVKAYKPRPADPEEVKRWEETDELGDKFVEAIEAYWDDKNAPCPYCTPPEGEKHAYTCWEAE